MYCRESPIPALMSLLLELLGNRAEKLLQQPISVEEVKKIFMTLYMVFQNVCRTVENHSRAAFQFRANMARGSKILTSVVDLLPCKHTLLFQRLRHLFGTRSSISWLPWRPRPTTVPSSFTSCSLWVWLVGGVSGRQ